MKNTKLIEFDYEKYKAGAKAVYRNGEVPQVVILPEKPNKDYPIISIDLEAGSHKHTIEGRFYAYERLHRKDLLLEVEEKSEPELFVNVYDNSEVGTLLCSKCYKSLEEALKFKRNSSLGTTYKLVKVEQQN